jgi:hypothetical protein
MRPLNQIDLVDTNFNHFDRGINNDFFYAKFQQCLLSSHKKLIAK